jgi:hypothetical protein
VELILNLVWVAVGAAALLAWLRWRPESRESKGRQLVVLLVILALLFPVISMTDDLWAAQNPAEPDTCQKRQLVSALMHWSVPTTMALASDPAIPPAPHYSRRAIELDSQHVSPQQYIGCDVFTRPPPTA